MLSAVYHPNVYSFQPYNPYEQLLLQQELQRRRQIEARIRRQIQLEQLERRQQYECARQIAELQRRREMELESMDACRYGRRAESPLEGLFASRVPRSSFARRRSASPAEPVTTVQANQRCGEEVTQNTESSNEPVAPVPVSTTPTPTPASQPSISSNEPQPEVEVEAEMVATANPSETSASHTTIAHILSTLTTLQSDFTFPAQLDFIAASSSPKLAYTSTNAPVHQYEHQLTGLLTQLDAVESYGDEGVRRARKEAVKMVERELEDLDGKKAEVWRMSRSEEASAKAEDAISNEENVETAVSNPDEVGPKVVETLAEVQGTRHEAVDILCVSLPENAADEQTEKPASDLTVASTSSTVDTTPVTPHSPTLPSPSIYIPSESLVDTIHSPVASISDVPQSPKSTSTTPALPSTDGDKPHHTSLSESSGSETSDSELDEFVEVDTDMDVETMSAVSLEEVEQERDLAMVDEWELDF